MTAQNSLKSLMNGNIKMAAWIITILCAAIGTIWATIINPIMQDSRDTAKKLSSEIPEITQLLKEITNNDVADILEDIKDQGEKRTVWQESVLRSQANRDLVHQQMCNSLEAIISAQEEIFKPLADSIHQEHQQILDEVKKEGD